MKAVFGFLALLSAASLPRLGASNEVGLRARDGDITSSKGAVIRDVVASKESVPLFSSYLPPTEFHKEVGSDQEAKPLAIGARTDFLREQKAKSF